MPQAPALSKSLREAEDIARATGQRATTAHLILAFFTVKNHAERLLRDRGIDEDRLLDLFPTELREPKMMLSEVLERSEQVAAGCGAREVDCLHVLVAMTRARESVAYCLLEATGEKLGLLRTRALTILTGAVPRWLAGKNRSQRPMRAERIERERSERAEREVISVSRRPARSRTDARPPGELGVRHDRRAALDWTPPLVQSKPSSRLARRAQIGAELAKRSAIGARRDAQVEAPSQAPDPIDALDEDPFDELAAPPLADDIEERQSHLERAKDPAGRWLLSPTDYPWLTSLGRNLSAEAARGELDRLVGRDKEIEELIDVLGKRRANNPCLIGEPGVGKTAVVEGLALRLVHADPRSALASKILIGLDVGALLVGTHLRGSFSEKLQGLKEEVKQSEGRVIVFFDELHTLVGAGSTGDGPQDAANELKSALARGDFPCIGATTYAEWLKHIEPDAALKRRFYPVLIKEPTVDEAIDILGHIITAYADHHHVRYADDALSAAVNLSARYITDRQLPDKAIALLDLAGSRTARAGKDTVTRQIIAELVAERTDLPVERLLSSDRDRLLQLELLLEKEIVGHRPQLHRIADVIRRNAAGFSTRRPQGVFLFLGPTGVGKTETAKAIAKILHGGEDRMIRFDLSEFSEAHAVARLVGAPPGYLGHDAGGQLTEAVRRKPGRVVLFDEIEKAHSEVLQILLQILDEGRLTDGRGQTVSFAEAIVVLTSNLGADLARIKRPIGFSATAQERQELSEMILSRAREQLPPELWSRIEERLVFTPLSREEVREIARLLAADSSDRLTKERGISYTLDDRAIDFLLEQGGYDLALGARPMRQILSRIVEAPIASRILEGRLHADEHVLVSTRSNGGLAFLVGEERMSLSQRPPR
jgi:ATP-dependent Clp protease ATP-binding subunit ClpC